MKAFIKNFVLGGLFILAIAAPALTVATPQPALAGEACEGRLLGIPPWYRGLTNDECGIVDPNTVPGAGQGISNFVWRIVLNVIEMALVATTYLTVFFILYGGFLYITGGAIPAQLEKARKTILNAVIGLVICLAAIGLTNLVFTIIS